MRLATPQEMLKIEELTERDFNITPEILMENAGALSAREIYTSYRPEISRGKIGILVGPGNNGGDALVVARHLVNLGNLATEIIVAEKGTTPLNKLQIRRAENQGIKIIHYKSPEDLRNYSLFVDGFFGIGLSRDLKDPYISIFKYLNANSAPIVALDIPSGLNALNGKTQGAVLKAEMTLTFGLAKPGLWTSNGSDCCGRIRVLPIGFPRTVLKSEAKSHFLVNETWARKKIPQKRKNSNKFSNGRLQILAGSPGTWGAAALCCHGACRIGAGYVTLLTQNKDDSKRYLGGDLGPEVLLGYVEEADFEKTNAFVVGPGSGKSEKIKDFILKLIKKNFKNVVIDADGLSEMALLNTKIPPSWILTPHAGELSRLINVDAAEIEKDRLFYAGEAANKFNCHILLKGHRSVIANSKGLRGIIRSGNTALAKAGTGDVLSGFIGGLLAQGLNTFEAMGLGAYLHGSIADQWIKKMDRNAIGLMASDLPIFLTEELKRLEHA